MTGRVSYSRYVRIADVDRYSRQGWLPEGRTAMHAPHGLYSVLMTYGGPGEPPRAPQREIEEEQSEESGEAK